MSSESGGLQVTVGYEHDWEESFWSIKVWRHSLLASKFVINCGTIMMSSWFN